MDSNKLKKILILFLSVFTIIFIFAKRAMAVCPLCAVAVGSGLGLSRWLGVDDSISGLWVGGLIVSMIIWTISWLDKKKINFQGKAATTAFAYYLLTILPLYFYKILGDPKNQLFYLFGFYFDKLALGIIAGSIGFYFGANLYNELKEKNHGKAYFPFQKVVMPVTPLIILSVLFYFLTK
ncbi:MAG: hypothetical protein AAB361_01350 [Patescibacteria group bacterium]